MNACIGIDLGGMIIRNHHQVIGEDAAVIAQVMLQCSADTLHEKGSRGAASRLEAGAPPTGECPEQERIQLHATIQGLRVVAIVKASF